jgi:hypothetical protein
VGRCLGGAELVGAELEEPGVELADQRDVEPVDPGHRMVGGVVALVEVHAGGEQEVPAAHAHRVALDVGPHPLALDDEPEHGLCVPVPRGLLAWAEVLDRGAECGGGVGGAW